MDKQPIETAPRDGTKIDVWVDGERICNVSWSFSVLAATGEVLVDPIWDGWARDGSVGQSYLPDLIRGQPSHWSPIDKGSELMSDSTALWAECPECSHQWIAAHLPMPILKCAALMKRAACPKCGNKGPVPAQQGAGELLIARAGSVGGS